MNIIYSFLFWTFIYRTARFLTQGSERRYLKDWSSKDDSRTISFYAVSTVHSMTMIFIPLYHFYHLEDYNLVVPFTEEQLTLLDMSLSYFMWDFYYIYLHNSKMFLVHHLLSIFYMLMFRSYPLANAYLVSIFLPEVTTPLLNMWTIGRMKKYEYFDKINGFFTYFYIAVRVFSIIPFSVYAFMELYNSDHIPNYVALILGAVSIIYSMGNITWSKNLYRGYKKWSLKRGGGEPSVTSSEGCGTHMTQRSSSTVN